MTASVREQALEIAGVRVRRLNIVVPGHTLQQLAATHRYDTSLVDRVVDQLARRNLHRTLASRQCTVLRVSR